MKVEICWLSLMLVGLLACIGEQPTSEQGANGESQTAEPVSRFERPDVGDQFPSFDSLTLDGDQWTFEPSSAELTMINLWATWCVPCRREIPELIDLQKRWSDDGLEIVGVSLDAPGMAPKIREFADEMKVNYLIVHDARQELLDQLRTPVIPTTALVDRNGSILWMHFGMVQGDDPGLTEILERELDRS